MKVGQARRLKDLERENTWLKTAVAGAVSITCGASLRSRSGVPVR
jgi:hypothetical protein